MNLWPDIFTDEYRNTPPEILSFQADTFDYRFREVYKVVAHCHYCIYEDTAKLTVMTTGLLESKSVEILEIHNANKYPCKVWFDGKVSRCRTRAELIGKLAWIFNHDKTINAIRRLRGL